MKNRIISTLVSMAMCFGIIIGTMPIKASAAGSITSVSSASDLATLASEVNAGTDYSGVTITLNNDIDLSGVTYTPIGNKDNPFKGTFNGNGKKITGLLLPGTVTESSAAISATVYFGLFGFLGEGGVVKNLTVHSADVTTNSLYDEKTVYYGYIAGYSEGTIQDCNASGGAYIRVDYGLSYMGGFAGFNDGIIENCDYSYSGSNYMYTAGSYGVYDLRYVDSHVGLIAGTNGLNGMISNCTAVGNAGGESQFAVPCVGGIAGDNKGNIVGCDANANVYSRAKFSLKAYTPTGALVGCNNGFISDSRSTGTVKGLVHKGEATGRSLEFDVGGFVGYNNGEIDNCHTYGDTTVRSYIEGGADYVKWADNEISHVGGFVGFNSGIITNSSATNVTVKGGFNHMGGFVGFNNRGRIEKSYAKNITIDAPDANYTNRVVYSGGFAGENKNGVLHLSYAETNINNQNAADRYNGGIVAVNDSGIVDGCYVIMDTMTGDRGAGVCYKNTGSIINSYAIVNGTQLNQQYSDVAENAGEVKNVFFNDSLGTATYATAKTLDAIKNLDTYKDWAVYDLMVIGENSYPTFDFGAAMSANKGLGTETSPYLIYDANDLDGIRYSPDSYYRLCADITLSGKWSPIGGNKADAFTGSLDGNGYTISGLDITMAGRNVYTGLFGYCDGAVIKNLNIKNATVTANTDATALNNIIHIGTIAGCVNNTTIENCAVESTVTATGMNVTAGLLAGYVDGTITGSIADGKISVGERFGTVANLNVGGAVGALNGTISECYANVPVEAVCASRNAAVKAGGVAGTVKGSIKDCGATGTIVTDVNPLSKDIFAGGIAAVLNGTVTGTYANTTASGNITCDGVAGSIYNSDVDAYYNNALSSSYGTPWNGASMSGASFMATLSSGDKYIRTVRDDNAVVPAHVYATRVSENMINTMTLNLNGTGNIYYTTDGSDPLSGKLYGGESITMNNIQQVRLAVESNGVKSEINPIMVDRGGSVNTSDLYFSMPITRTVDNQLATPENIKTSGGVYTSIYSEKAIDSMYVYICSYNAAMRLNNVIVKPMSLVAGENRVTFTADELKFTDSDAIWQVYAWGAKQKPLTEQVKVEN